MDERQELRHCTPDGHDRRWWQGAGGPVPPGTARLLARGMDGGRLRVCAFRSAGRAAGPGIDQVDAEHVLWALCDAGLVRIHERRDRRGEWEAYQWVLTPAGVAALPLEERPVAVEPYLAMPEPFAHPVLESIRAFLAGGQGKVPTQPMVLRLLMQIGQEIRAGRVPRGRLLSVEIGGHTKAVRVMDYRSELEEALGFPVEQVVRVHGRAVLLYGPLYFRVRGVSVPANFSVPWLALTQETLRDLDVLEVRAQRILTIENLVALEEEVRAGLPEDTLAVFTGGFPSSLEQELLRRVLVAGPVREVMHWGDMDLGGLRILRFLEQCLQVPVVPYRMEPELLTRLPTQPLTGRDRKGLRVWCADPEAPCRALARALLDGDCKAEQEGWFLVPGLGQPDNPTSMALGELHPSGECAPTR